MLIYIAGAISSDPEYREKFAAAEKHLKDLGHEVINPADHNGINYKDYIDKGLRQLMNCDAIYLLPDWIESPGAKLECAYAATIGMKRIYAEAGEKESITG